MLSVARRHKADIKMLTTSSSIIAVSRILALQTVPTSSDVGRSTNPADDQVAAEYFLILMTRKVPSTSEKQFVMVQRMLYYLRNLLVFALGIDELERSQNPQILMRMIKHAYDPLVSAMLAGGMAQETYFLQDRINVSLHKTGTSLETAELLKGL